MDPKETAWRYLRGLRETVLWKVDGVNELELRRPRTPTGSNLLGIVKHLAAVEVGYFGECLGRPWIEPLPCLDDDAQDNADMWATEDESAADIIDFYRRAIAFADETIGPLPADAPATVPWWRDPATDLHTLLVHMTAETARHAGHLDILREHVDGAVGLRAGGPNLPNQDEQWWADYVARLEAVAHAAASRYASG